MLVPSPFGAFERLERAGGLPAGFVRTVNSTDPDTNAWARFERGEIGVQRFCELFGAEARALGHEVDARSVVEPLLAPLGGADRAVPDMLAAARSCRAHGVRTALITNNVVPMDRATAAWVFDTFDVVLESCVVGSRKPEPAVYRVALDALGVEADRAVMLDDLGINLKPARTMGMRTIKVGDPVAAARELTALLALPAA